MHFLYTIHALERAWYMSKSRYKLYTDGSFRQPCYGAWGAILFEGKKKKPTRIEAHPVFNTTSQRMELMAIIEGIKWIDEPSHITIYSDSKYAVFSIKTWITRWAQNNWMTFAGSPVRNKDLMQELYRLKKKHTLSPVWVRGHNGDTYNEECDRNVQAVTSKMVLGEIKPPEKTAPSDKK